MSIQKSAKSLDDGMGIIFVGGVHGVGKSTSCKLATGMTGIPCHAASAIIKAESESAKMCNSKEVDDADGNQRLLLQGVKRISPAAEIRFLLDGHFTLVSSRGQIERIHERFFSLLGLDGVVVYLDRPDKIAMRLQERDRVLWSPSRVASQQDAEIEHAQNMARLKGVPFVSLEAFDTQGLVKAVWAIWGSSFKPEQGEMTP